VTGHSADLHAIRELMLGIILENKIDNLMVMRPKHVTEKQDSVKARAGV